MNPSGTTGLSPCTSAWWLWQPLAMETLGMARSLLRWHIGNCWFNSKCQTSCQPRIRKFRKTIPKMDNNGVCWCFLVDFVGLGSAITCYNHKTEDVTPKSERSRLAIGLLALVGVPLFGAWDLTPAVIHNKSLEKLLVYPKSYRNNHRPPVYKVCRYGAGKDCTNYLRPSSTTKLAPGQWWFDLFNHFESFFARNFVQAESKMLIVIQESGGGFNCTHLHTIWL